MPRRQLTLIEGGAPARASSAPAPEGELAELRSLVGQVIQGALGHARAIDDLTAWRADLAARYERDLTEQAEGTCDVMRRMDDLEEKLDAQSGLIAAAIARLDRFERRMRAQEGAQPK